MAIVLSYISEKIKQSVEVKKKKMIAIIFDIDGTLVDSSDFDGACYISAPQARFETSPAAQGPSAA